MINHEAALQTALIARLRADDTLDALVGGRVWDGDPVRPGEPVESGVRMGRGGDGRIGVITTLPPSHM